jgi:SET domain-containing protein
MNEREKQLFEVKESLPGVGQGLFARTPLAKDSFILEYIGKHIPSADADVSKSRFLFEIDDQWTIEGDVPENTARYINHACDPNTEAEIEDGKINIYAIRDIAPGEELTIDYGEEYFDEFIRPIGCRCVNCRTLGFGVQSVPVA